MDKETEEEIIDAMQTLVDAPEHVIERLNPLQEAIARDVRDMVNGEGDDLRIIDQLCRIEIDWNTRDG